MEPEGKKRVLGRGLSALISGDFGKLEEVERKMAGEKAVVPENVLPAAEEKVFMIPIKDIVPNPDQPRQAIAEEALSELADSIREQGILQPVVVTMRNNEYALVCGERRVRAAALAGLEKVPAVVKEVSSARLLEMALVENIQREDLNPLEEALAYAKLIEERMVTQEDLAKRVGKTRSTIANTVRLLRLPREIQEYVASSVLSEGHARALLALISPEHQRVLAARILKENLSVRQTEELAQGLLSGKKRARRARHLDAYVQDLERRLEQRLGTRVRVFHNKKNQGRVEIRYFSLDDLDRVLAAIGIEKS